MSWVCGHSKPVKPGHYVIFAATGYERSYVHKFLESAGVAYKDLEGCFDGVEEHSYIVHSDDYDLILPIIWREQAVLWLGEPKLDSRRDAWVRYRDGTPSRYLGQFTHVTSKRAKSEGAWTYDSDAGAYYVCSNLEGGQLPLPFLEGGDIAHSA